MGDPKLDMNELEARRYRITGILGKGGFGKVYRASLEGAGGFTKDVAVKLMHDRDVPELQLRRFRDEARILGLVRDRAIVNVDPPTRLAGQWAVVMEYVDGASVQRLMKLGPIPPTVVAELVQEVARALDKVYRQPGPDGEPLRLVHRDIKPANIQVTPDGEVKILDFGIAKAEFANREAHTQAYIGGTRGFMAPERLEGIDGPEGDIFSLGVTAHCMLTSERPTRRQMMGLEEPDTSEVEAEMAKMLMLATAMRSIDPADRPTAREVEERCSELRRHAQGISLRRWAEQVVPEAAALSRDDDMIGHVLTETLAVLPTSDRIAGGMDLVRHTGDVRPKRSLLPVVVAMGLVTLLLVLVGLSTIASGIGVWLATQPGTVATLPQPPAPAPGAPSRPAPAKETPAPAKEMPAPAPASSPRPAPEAPAPVAVAPVPQPTPAPPAEVATQPVTFASVPLGADVYIDGTLVGQTPLMGHEVPEGRHEVKMVSDFETVFRRIEVGRRTPVRHVWKGGENWESHY